MRIWDKNCCMNSFPILTVCYRITTFTSQWEPRILKNKLPMTIKKTISWSKFTILTYSMVQSPSWEANWFTASQEIPRISRNPKVHYRTHKRLPPVSILGQPNPVHIPTSHLLEIHSNIIHTSDCFVSRASVPHVSVSQQRFLQGGVVSTLPNPQAGRPPLIGCPRPFIQFIRSYLPYQRPFLYRQPEDTSCHGDRDPLHGIYTYLSQIVFTFPECVVTLTYVCVFLFS